MTISAQSVARRVVDILQDVTSVRWTLNEVVRSLNDGQREIVLNRPDAMVTTTNVTCVVGTRQAIPANGAKLIDVIRNFGSTSSRAVRQVQRETLDAQVPGWHAVAGQDEVLHFMFDPRNPKIFYVYPPALATSKVDVVYAAMPTDIAEPGAGVSLPVSSAADTSAPTAVIGNLSVPDIFANALVDFILYRLYMKDASYAGNAQRAAAHYGSFANALGLEIKATVAVAPGQVIRNTNAGATDAAQ